MVEVTLCCALLVGAQEGVFPVTVDANKLVGGLKEAIKDQSDGFIKASHLTLELFLGKMGNAWLDGAGMADVTVDETGVVSVLDKDGNRHVFVKMDPWLRISNRHYFGEKFQPDEDQVHVVVVVPKPKEEFEQNKRLRVEVETVDNVPQIDIDSDEKYITLPAAFVDQCGLVSNGDLMMYRRPQVDELWKVLREIVIASLDREEWNVVWVHWTDARKSSCLVMGTKQHWFLDDLAAFLLPRLVGKRLFLCVDGYKYIPEHKKFLGRIFAHLRREERLVICSSMGTLGKRNVQDDMLAKVEYFFFKYSWNQDEYFDAIKDEAFYEKVEAKFDATSVSEVNDEGNEKEDNEEDDKKKRACALKFYYAGGSSRFMFQFTTEEVKKILKEAVHSAGDKTKLVEYCSGAFHTAAINRLYGMTNDGADSGRFPVSSYAASLFAHECGTDVIVKLAHRLNASNNPSVDGHLFEWLFFASVPQRKVELFTEEGVKDVLPQANVFRFDPKKPFQKYPDRVIKADKHWLQPVAFNQGSYDAVYVDAVKGEVIFVQVTRSDKHDFKMNPFHDVLQQLKWSKVKIWKVMIYFVVKPSQFMNFKINHIDGRDQLEQFDASWTRPEENNVKVRAFEAAPSEV